MAQVSRFIFEIKIFWAAQFRPFQDGALVVESDEHLKAARWVNRTQCHPLGLGFSSRCRSAIRIINFAGCVFSFGIGWRITWFIRLDVFSSVGRFVLVCRLRSVGIGAITWFPVLGDLVSLRRRRKRLPNEVVAGEHEHRQHQERYKTLIHVDRFPSTRTEGATPRQESYSARPRRYWLAKPVRTSPKPLSVAKKPVFSVGRCPLRDRFLRRSLCWSDV